MAMMALTLYLIPLTRLSVALMAVTLIITLMALNTAFTAFIIT